MKRSLLLGIVAVLLLLSGLALAASGLVGAAGSAPPPVPTAPVSTVTPGISTSGPGYPDPRAVAPAPAPINAPQRPEGVPAIKPIGPNAGPNGAAFSEQVVRDYIQRVGVQGIKLAASSPVTVVAVEFLPARQVDERLKLQTGQPEAAILCLVTVRGSFTVAGPPGMTPLTFQTAVQVYDANTGNLLLQGQAPGAP